MRNLQDMYDAMSTCMRQVKATSKLLRERNNRSDAIHHTLRASARATTNKSALIIETMDEYMVTDRQQLTDARIKGLMRDSEKDFMRLVALEGELGAMLRLQKQGKA